MNSAPGRVAGIKNVAQIPTLNTLYDTSLLAAVAGPPARTPSRELNSRVSFIRADITKLQVGAVVNAANSSLRGGGGVDGAIHRAAGPRLLAECVAACPDADCPTGHAVLTSGACLPARFVIHAVGPVYCDARTSEPLLRSCYDASLCLAQKHEIRTLAFSGISTGVYGYPSGEAAQVACDAVRRHLEADTTGLIQRVVFVTFEHKDTVAYAETLPQYFPPAEYRGFM